MHVRIEKIDDSQPEEVVVYCRSVRPEIERLVQRIQQQDKASVLSFFKDDEQYYLSLQEILFFETDGDRIYAHTTDDAYEVQYRLYQLERLLPISFVRVSRSCIVNTRHVFSIQKSLTRVNCIAFRHTYKEVYGSRQFSQQLFEKMNERYRYENE
ncbi:MAG: LytTR family transcriptional regulator [Clostridiaceae bacterium]|nr:LytTR family transcriptional regulator [Clostridiaceae bacterium]